MLNEGNTIRTMIKRRPAVMGRFAVALEVADESIIWASPDGDGLTWNVMFAKTTSRDKSTPVFVVQMWESGGEIVPVTEPTQVGTLGDFAELITLLARQQGGGDGRVH